MISRAWILALSLVAISIQTASAHATVLSCEPPIGANLPEPPAQLVCHFNEPLEVDNSALVVMDPQGERVDKGDTKVSGADTATLAVTLAPSKMGTGLYTVQWIVTSLNDNAVTQSQFQFGVRTVVPPTRTPALPGTVVTPPLTQDTGLVPRFLVGAGVAVLVASLFMMWKMRRDSRSEQIHE